MKKVLSIVDSYEYINQTPYNRQFQITLQNLYDTTIVDLRSFVLESHVYDLKKFDIIVSSLKLRSLVKNLNVIQSRLGSEEIHVYDQDPWESFNSSGPWNNSYYRISEALNIKKFINTSAFWSNFCKERGLPADFITMGIMPQSCSYGQDWDKRQYDSIFMGHLHGWRETFFNRVTSLGVNVSILSRSSHEEFLRTVENAKIFIHNTSNPPFTIDGKQWEIFYGYPWVKGIEIAGKGCYTLTNKRGSTEEYHIDKIPLIKMFSDIEEIPEIVAGILNQTKEDALSDIRTSVDYIKKYDYWKTSVSNVLG